MVAPQRFGEPKLGKRRASVASVLLVFCRKTDDSWANLIDTERERETAK